MSTVSNERYSRTAIALHWLMAALLLVQIGIGTYMVDIPKRTPPVAFYYNLHKSLGLVALALVLVRLWWKSSHPAPSLSTLSLSPLKLLAARISHRLLYVCMLMVPVCGFIATSFSKHSIVFFGYPLPRLGWEDQFVQAVFSKMHFGFSYLLCGLIVVHVLAVVSHVATSGMLIVRRMLPH
jgi:cytochrome b561